MPALFHPRLMLMASLAMLCPQAASAAEAPVASKASNSWVRLDDPGATAAAAAKAAAGQQLLPAVPLAGDSTAGAEPACRVRKTVEASVAMGGVRGTHVGAELAYGRDDLALAAGYPPNPCPTTGFGMSVHVSQSDLEIKNRRRYYGDSYDAARDPYGRTVPGPADFWGPEPIERLDGR